MVTNRLVTGPTHPNSIQQVLATNNRQSKLMSDQQHLTQTQAIRAIELLRIVKYRTMIKVKWETAIKTEIHTRMLIMESITMLQEKV